MKNAYLKIIWKELEPSLAITGLILSTFLSLINIFITNNIILKVISSASVILFVIIYFIAMIKKYSEYKKTKKISIKFGDSEVNVFYGNIFSEDNVGYKVIAFNEYYDIITDDKQHIIDKNSLHGQYLDKFYPNMESREKFHKRIENELREYVSYKNSGRKCGYTQAYNLGTLFEDNDYLLMSFTKFDKCNKAHVKYSEMITSFIKMWFNIDKVKGSKKVYLPLIGSGITRFDDGRVSNNEILISLIETFRISRVKFKHPANVNIILYGENLGIDLILIKNRYTDKKEN